MRLEKIQDYLKKKGWEYTYVEEDGCGSIELMYRGVPYHIWEFEDNGWGAESNVRNGGKSEDFTESYEETIIDIMEHGQ